MQNILISDKSGVMRLTLWEKMVGTLKVGKCYSLMDLFVKVFDDVKCLSYPRNGRK